MTDPAHTITNIARLNGIPLSEQQETLLSRYGELLLDWNRKINLISRRDEENVWYSHILHSLSLLFFVRLPPQGHVLDLGTGGGLPGIPLAIVRQDLDMVLMDSILKKTRAVQDMVGRLGIKNVRVVCARAEEFGKREEFAHSFDVVVARAVAPLQELIRWSKPVLKVLPATVSKLAPLKTLQLPHDIPSPYLLCMKGGDLEGELQKARVKAGAANILVLELVFKGDPVPSLENKKILVFQP